MLKKRAQTTIEYVLLLTLILLGIFYGVNKVMKDRVKDVMDTSGQVVEKGSTALKDALGLDGGSGSNNPQ